MSKFREPIVTNCERKFLTKCLSDDTRLDGRSFDEFRPLQIEFGKDWGCCCVSLGKTKVLAQTSCEIQTPKSSRPSEGILNINIELNPLAAAHFEPGRQSELSVILNRLLEKCVKDSKAVDLESLCIKTNEKVWALRVDVNVLNHDGNILDCASIALLSSLAHFRRPDVTCDGEEFIIHSYQQRDPIPTVIHHYPVCISYSIFNGGEFILADPSLIEEGVADASLIISLNSFKELCGLHLGGKAELMPNVIMGTVGKATRRAGIVIEEIKEATRTDVASRQKQTPSGFHLEQKKVSTSCEMSLDHWTKKQVKSKKKKKEKSKETLEKCQVEVIAKGSVAHVLVETPSKKEQVWEVDSSGEDELMIVEQPKESIQLHDSDSEEEDVVILDTKNS